MTPSKSRERRLDAIRRYSDQLTELGRRYDRLRWMAEREECSDAFLTLAEAVGKLSIASLQQLGALLEILRTAHDRETQNK